MAQTAGASYNNPLKKFKYVATENGFMLGY
jgi:hypothetical protein